MNPVVEAKYAEFEKLGPVEVRKRLASHVYGEDNARHAENWLALKDHEAESLSRDAIMTSAREANALAREANSIAREAADAASEAARAAKNNNTIATIALAISVMAIATSVIGIFSK